MGARGGGGGSLRSFGLKRRVFRVVGGLGSLRLSVLVIFSFNAVRA